jgi:hypothetical protein
MELLNIQVLDIYQLKEQALQHLLNIHQLKKYLHQQLGHIKVV